MTIVRFDLGCRSVGTPRLGGRRGNTGVSKGNTSNCGMFRISGEEMDGMMIRMFIRDEARGNEALSGVLFNNPPALPACLVEWGLMTDCLSVLCFCLYSLS